MTIDRVQSLLLTIVCIWMLIPIFAYGDVYRLIVVGAMSLYIFLELIRRQSAFLAIRRDCIYTATFILISLVFFYIAETLLHRVGFLIFTFFLFIYWLKQGKKLIFTDHLYVILFFMLVTLILSIYFLSFVDAHAARVIVRSSDLARQYSSFNIGGYGFVYSCLILLPIIFFEMRKQHRLKNNLKLIFLFIFFLCAAIYIYLGGYTIAFAGLLIALLFLMPFFRERVVMITLITLPLGMIIFLGDSLANLMPASLLELFSGTSYFSKLNAIIYYDANDLIINDSFEVRRERYQRSLDLFFNNVFTGVFDFNEVGKHSTILDTAAMYGIFYISFFVLLIFRFLIHAYNLSKSRLVLVTGYLFFYVIILNNLVLQFAVILFVFLPGILIDNYEESD